MPSESDTNTEKENILSGVRRGIHKLFGAAREMTASFIKSTLSVLKLDIKIFRKYKKRFDKHTDHEQIRWWFEIWGDESALKALESEWEQVSAENKSWAAGDLPPCSCPSSSEMLTVLPPAMQCTHIQSITLNFIEAAAASLFSLLMICVFPLSPSLSLPSLAQCGVALSGLA